MPIAAVSEGRVYRPSISLADCVFAALPALTQTLPHTPQEPQPKPFGTGEGASLAAPDAVTQKPQDQLMRLCKGLKTLAFTVNRELVINQLPVPAFLFIVIQLRITLPGDRDVSDLSATSMGEDAAAFSIGGTT
jgi:hypothetical protein